MRSRTCSSQPARRRLPWMSSLTVVSCCRMLRAMRRIADGFSVADHPNSCPQSMPPHPQPQFPPPIMKRRLCQSPPLTKLADAQPTRSPPGHPLPPLPFQPQIPLPSCHALLLDGKPPRLTPTARRHFTVRSHPRNNEVVKQPHWIAERLPTSRLSFHTPEIVTRVGCHPAKDYVK